MQSDRDSTGYPSVTLHCFVFAGESGCQKLSVLCFHDVCVGWECFGWRVGVFISCILFLCVVHCCDWCLVFSLKKGDVKCPILPLLFLFLKWTFFSFVIIIVRLNKRMNPAPRTISVDVPSRKVSLKLAAGSGGLG